MSHGRPGSSGWLFGAAVAVAVGSLTAAAQPQTPTLSTSTSPAIESPEILRKPPPATNPWPEKVRAAVRAIYPELFATPAADSVTLVVVALNSDGTVYKSTKRAMGAETVDTSQKTYDAVGVDLGDFQAVGTTGPSDGTEAIVLGNSDIGASVAIRLNASAQAQDPVEIFYGVLYSTLDPKRPTSQVRTAVQKRYAHLVRRPKAGMFERVTVYMTAAGGIDRAKTDTLNLAERQPAFLAPDDFLVLGLTPDQVGAIGQTVISEGAGTPHDPSRVLLINYAWPRKSFEGPAQPVANQFAFATSDGGVTLAIVNHYIADAFTAPESAPEPWILLDHDGKVLRAGRFSSSDWQHMTEPLSALFPGMRMQQCSFAAVTDAAGKSVMVNFVWLAPDSPVPDVVGNPTGAK